MFASVEIIFDNTDRRFPAEGDEVSIKRTIGLKKNEYFLNNNHTQWVGACICECVRDFAWHGGVRPSPSLEHSFS